METLDESGTADCWLDVRDAAQHLGVKRSFFLTKVAVRLPGKNLASPNALRRALRWRRSTLDAWAESSPGDSQ